MRIYAARDMSGRLFIYFYKKPVKDSILWLPMHEDYCESSEDLPSVKWEDEEPTEVEFDYFTRKLKLKEKRNE